MTEPALAFTHAKATNCGPDALIPEGTVVEILADEGIPEPFEAFVFATSLLLTGKGFALRHNCTYLDGGSWELLPQAETQA